MRRISKLEGYETDAQGVNTSREGAQRRTLAWEECSRTASSSTRKTHARTMDTFLLVRGSAREPIIGWITWRGCCKVCMRHIACRSMHKAQSQHVRSPHATATQYCKRAVEGQCFVRLPRSATTSLAHSAWQVQSRRRSSRRLRFSQDTAARRQSFVQSINQSINQTVSIEYPRTGPRFRLGC